MAIPKKGRSGRRAATSPSTRRRKRAPPSPGAASKSKVRGDARPAEAGVRVHIRNFGAPVTEEDRDYLRRKLAARLARFGRQVERASVRLEDVNGPRGGKDKRCRIKVVLTGLPSVTVEELQRTTRAAIDGALGRVGSAVRRALERRRGPPPAPRRARAALGAARADE
jgi:hypothetical protein